MTKEQMNDWAFYESVLEWSSSVWDSSYVNIDNSIYPTLNQKD